jgi:toxin ParE1/3/4
MRRVHLHPLALREIATANRRSERDRPGSGPRLLSAVDHTIARVGTVPGQGSPYLHGTRRFIVHRFPFSTVYLARVPVSHVVAIAHHRRRPGYWRRRMKDI